MRRNSNGKYYAITVILTSALITGCSSNGNETNGSSSSPKPSASASTATTKPLEAGSFRMLTELSPGWPAKPDWPIWKWVKEKTNITVKQETQTGPESLALAIASGDMPDVFALYVGDAQKYGPQGAFLDLSKHLDKMPNVKTFLAAHPDVAQRMTSPGGEMYQLINDGAGAGNQMVWFYRNDILQKNSLQEPKTWDELYDTAKKLKQVYPDSYPFVFRHGLGTLNTFGPAFGVYPGIYEDQASGKIKYGATDPNFKKMIEYLNKFHKEGLIPPDWLTMDYKAWTQFITTNKSFMTVQFIGQIETMNTQFKNGEHLKFMAPPIGAGGKPYLPRGNYETLGFSVSSKTKNLDAVLRYLDFTYSKEGTDVLSWGKEGESYTVDNGKRKITPTIKEANELRKETGIMTAGTYGQFDYSAVTSMSNENEKYSYAEAAKYQFPVTNVLPALTSDEKSAIMTTEEQINKYYETSIAKFILGETPLTQWDTFTSEMNKLGLQKMLDAYQKAFDRVKVKK
ncbi:extracellular solute-binding protein [Paenibacillus qinlingensis]|uniref:extracellular solute-binding protein n=1 Tax=Paenibacillus qinlingensis TaxID=1837343 RepID=UPI001565FBA5|nr:extracellular solute-binding protein [Paenibacillus qinlingensis]NQX62449.1 extracellular solute-binding protein [Paenibacillus qinlingensis]